MARKQDIRDEIGEIKGSYTSGCIVCRGSTQESKIDIYYLHWNCYKLMRLLRELEQL